MELRDEGVVGHVGITDLQLENLKWVVERVPAGTVESVLNFCHYCLNDDKLEDFFDDFEDILVQAGISDSDKVQFESVLNSCIMYKAATEWFLQGSGGFKIDTFSGLSMYLPCNGSAYLNNFYRTLEWNKVTELVD